MKSLLMIASLFLMLSGCANPDEPNLGQLPSCEGRSNCSLCSCSTGSCHMFGTSYAYCY